MKKIIFSLLFAFVAAFSFAQADTTKPKKKGELIQPIRVWKDGKLVDAQNIDLTSVFDDLESSAKLYYVLKDSVGAQLAEGNLSIDADDYRQMNVAPNKIAWVYRYAIRQLKLQTRPVK